MFWYPSDPEIMYQGKLVFDETFEPELTLYFQGYPKDITVFDKKTMFGILNDGKPITLSGVKYQGLGSNQIISELKFYCGLLLIGGHYSNHNQIAFSTYQAKFDNLRIWAGRSGISFTFPTTAGTFSYSYTKPKPISIPLDDCIISIDNSFEQHTELNLASLKEEIVIDFTFEDEVQIDSFRQGHLGYMRDFLSIGFYSRQTLVSLFGIENKNHPQDRNEIEIIFNQMNIPEEIEIHPNWMLFSLSDIQNSIAHIYTNWISLYDDYKDSIMMYASTLYKPDMYIQSKFINLAFAIEYFHKKKNSKYLNKCELGTIRRIISIALLFLRKKPNIRKVISSRMGNMIGITYRERLIDLMSNEGADIAMAIEDIDQLAKDISNTRNYLVHRGKKIPPTAKGRSIFSLCIILEILISIILLSKMDFDKQLRVNIIERFIRSHQFLNIIEEYKSNL